MATNKTIWVKSRKDLTPDESRYEVKDIIVPFYVIGLKPELLFYFDEIANSLCLTARTTADLWFFEKPTDLTNPVNYIWIRIVK